MSLRFPESISGMLDEISALRAEVARLREALKAVLAGEDEAEMCWAAASSLAKPGMACTCWNGNDFALATTCVRNCAVCGDPKAGDK